MQSVEISGLKEIQKRLEGYPEAMKKARSEFFEEPAERCSPRCAAASAVRAMWRMCRIGTSVPAGAMQPSAPRQKPS